MDDRELRRRILRLSHSEPCGLGIGKSTLHYLKKHAKDRKPFRIYGPVLAKLTVDATLFGYIYN